MSLHSVLTCVPVKLLICATIDLNDLPCDVTGSVREEKDDHVRYICWLCQPTHGYTSLGPFDETNVSLFIIRDATQK